MPDQPPRRVLLSIVIGELLATSVWFAPNAVIGALQPYWGIDGGEGIVTTAVQLGFIIGTLSFAVFGVADRFHASRVFLVCALISAATNLAVIVAPGWFAGVLFMRFVTGVSLAGVYPVGMKIASGWYRGGLGKALGLLVGALVLGTASPHLLEALGQDWQWQFVLVGSSLAAGAGGLLVGSVPEGPFARSNAPVRFRGVLRAFRVPRFRAAVFGYFGHMWELFTLWAFAPVWIASYGLSGSALSLTSFAVIGMGALGCAGGGYLVESLGSGRVALGALAVSGLCCLVSPLLFTAPLWLALAFLLIWGLAAAADSPQFSALNAEYAPPELIGSALTLANCVGFAISIGSLNLLEWLQHEVPAGWLFPVLAIGPAAGLWAGRALLPRPEAAPA